MSQMYPSSSHQLVAAAFRRARKRFPTNFGQLSWHVQNERKDNKVEQPQSSTRCKKCEEFFASSLIRSVRSGNVWPRFASSWTTDHRSARSMRHNSALPRRRMVGRTNRADCDCRRIICGSSGRHVSVSFSEEGKSNSRCSGGDVAEERSSIETVSSKSCRSRLRRKDCSSVERFDDAVEEKRNKNEGTQRTRRRSCIRADKRSTNLERIDRLDLLYDRNDMTKNSVSFFSGIKEPDANDSPDEDETDLDFPSKLNEWENRSREDTVRSGGGLGRFTGDQITVNCSCAGEKGRFREENDRGHRHRSHQPRFERNQYRRERSPMLRNIQSAFSANPFAPDRTRSNFQKNTHLGLLFWRDKKKVASKILARAKGLTRTIEFLTTVVCNSSLCRELLLRAEGSRASSSTKETNRHCKYCARVQRSRNSSLVQSHDEDEDEADEQCGGARGDEVCAIKHKDSMAILVEKFKNKRNSSSCSDDETTIFKSDEETSPPVRGNGRKISRDDKQASKESENADVDCCKVRGYNGKSISEAGKFRRHSKSLRKRSGYCCSAKEGSCSHDS